MNDNVFLGSTCLILVFFYIFIYGQWIQSEIVFAVGVMGMTIAIMTMAVSFFLEGRGTGNNNWV